ncbi:MAG: galactosyltransferase-related protein [Myxococcales bacterium]
MVLAVRLHQGNPWLLDRITVLRQHYRELPATVVVDFGSAEPFRSQLASVCAANGLIYVFEDDQGTYSAARARNLGARASQTALLFFNDVDCFGEADLFERLVEHANRLEMGSYLEQVVNLPVYSLGEDETNEVWSAPPAVRGELLARGMIRKAYQRFDTQAYQYVDPASNFFLIRRDFFELVGGYNESFRGHGSEDFEFFLRLAHYTDQFPLPEAFERDLYSPANPAFFGHKLYRGFRRYMELMAFQAECAGLRVAHLYHARGQGSWYEQKDRGKRRFAEQIEGYRKSPSQLLERDWLPREKRALVLLKHEQQYQYFLPLRLLGYRLQLMLSGDAESEGRARQALESGQVDVVAVFNPYMGSHKELWPWVERARAKGVKLLVTDRGMLPESWFFAEDMPYGDSEYTQLDPARWLFDEEELGDRPRVRAHAAQGRGHARAKRGLRSHGRPT